MIKTNNDGNRKNKRASSITSTVNSVAGVEESIKAKPQFNKKYYECTFASPIACTTSVDMQSFISANCLARESLASSAALAIAIASSLSWWAVSAVSFQLFACFSWWLPLFTWAITFCLAASASAVTLHASSSILCYVFFHVAAFDFVELARWIVCWSRINISSHGYNTFLVPLYHCWVLHVTFSLVVVDRELCIPFLEIQLLLFFGRFPRISFLHDALYWINKHVHEEQVFN